MNAARKAGIVNLLKGIETGDARAAQVVNETVYIQHNPQTHEGSEGLAALFRRLAATSPRVNIVRVFADGDYVFAHTEYDFAERNIGFEIFRFDGEQAVEHWDNIQRRLGPNPAGRSMVDGPTEATDTASTRANRDLVRSFTHEVLIKRRFEGLPDYFDNGHLVQHHPAIGDGVAALRDLVEARDGNPPVLQYERNHRVLAEGNFVLSVSEGLARGRHAAIFDLYRVAEERLVEHWDTIEAIPPRGEWKNDNGKFNFPGD